MKVYLDNCCFNRPYDDQSFVTIQLETTAKLTVQKAIRSMEIELIWSFMLDLENGEHPYDEIREAISIWSNIATYHVSYSDTIRSQANEFASLGIGSKDAIHLACAIEGKAGYFLTTDRKVLNKDTLINSIQIINPISFISILEANNG